MLLWLYQLYRHLLLHLHRRLSGRLLVGLHQLHRHLLLELLGRLFGRLLVDLHGFLFRNGVGQLQHLQSSMHAILWDRVPQLLFGRVRLLLRQQLRRMRLDMFL